MTAVEKKSCPDCGRSYIGHIGYHAERCTGPQPALVKLGTCDCPPGWRHLPGCPEASWPEPTA